MGKLKCTIADSFNPQAGIFEYIDGNLIIMTDDVNPSAAVGGMVEMRQYFHQDLLKMAVHYYNLKQSTIDYINKHNFQVWTEYPRGRVCYQVNEDKYYVFGPMDVLTDSNKMRQLISEFNLPANKVIRANDPEYDIKK